MPASVNAAGPSVPSRAKPHKSNARKDASRAHDTEQLLKLVAFDDLLAFYTARRTKKGTIEWKEFPRRSPVDVLKGASDASGLSLDDISKGPKIIEELRFGFTPEHLRAAKQLVDMWRETRKSKYFSLVLQNGSLGFKQVKRIPKDKYLDDDVLDLPVPELNALVLNTGAPGIAQDLVDRGVPSGLLLRGPQKKAPWTLFLGPGSHVKRSCGSCIYISPLLPKTIKDNIKISEAVLVEEQGRFDQVYMFGGPVWKERCPHPNHAAHSRDYTDPEDHQSLVSSSWLEPKPVAGANADPADGPKDPAAEQSATPASAVARQRQPSPFNLSLDANLPYNQETSAIVPGEQLTGEQGADEAAEGTGCEHELDEQAEPAVRETSAREAPGSSSPLTSPAGLGAPDHASLQQDDDAAVTGSIDVVDESPESLPIACHSASQGDLTKTNSAVFQLPTDEHQGTGQTVPEADGPMPGISQHGKRLLKSPSNERHRKLARVANGTPVRQPNSGTRKVPAPLDLTPPATGELTFRRPRYASPRGPMLGSGVPLSPTSPPSADPLVTADDGSNDGNGHTATGGRAARLVNCPSLSYVLPILEPTHHRQSITPTDSQFARHVTAQASVVQDVRLRELEALLAETRMQLLEAQTTGAAAQDQAKEQEAELQRLHREVDRVGKQDEMIARLETTLQEAESRARTSDAALAEVKAAGVAADSKMAEQDVELERLRREENRLADKDESIARLEGIVREAEERAQISRTALTEAQATAAAADAKSKEQDEELTRLPQLEERLVAKESRIAELEVAMREGEERERQLQTAHTATIEAEEAAHKLESEKLGEAERQLHEQGDTIRTLQGSLQEAQETLRSRITAHQTSISQHEELDEQLRLLRDANATASTKISDTEARLQEIEQQLEQAQKARQDAEKSSASAETELQRLLVLEVTLTEKTEEAEELSKKLKTTEEQREQAEASLKEAVASSAKQSKVLARLHDVEKAAAATRKELGSVQGQLDEKQKELARALQDKLEAGERANRQDEEIARLAKVETTLRAGDERLRQDLAAKQTAINDEQEAHRLVKAALVDKTREMSELESRHTELTTKQHQRETELDKARTELAESRLRDQQLSRKVQQLETEARDQQTASARLRTELSTTKAEIGTTKKSLETENATLRAQVQDAKKDREEEISALQSDLEKRENALQTKLQAFEAEQQGKLAALEAGRQVLRESKAAVAKSRRALDNDRKAFTEAQAAGRLAQKAREDFLRGEEERVKLDAQRQTKEMEEERATLRREKEDLSSKRTALQADRTAFEATKKADREARIKSEAMLASRRTAIETREAAIARKEAELQSQKADHQLAADKAEQELAVRSKTIAQRESDLESAENRLRTEQTQLQADKVAAEGRETELAKREKLMASNRATFGQDIKEYQANRFTVKVSLAKIESDHATIKADRSRLDADVKSLRASQSTVEKDRETVAKQKEDLAGQKKELEKDKEAHLESCRALAAAERALEDLRDDKPLHGDSSAAELTNAIVKAEAELHKLIDDLSAKSGPHEQVLAKLFICSRLVSRLRTRLRTEVSEQALYVAGIEERHKTELAAQRAKFASSDPLDFMASVAIHTPSDDTASDIASSVHAHVKTLRGLLLEYDPQRLVRQMELHLLRSELALLKRKAVKGHASPEDSDVEEQLSILGDTADYYKKRFESQKRQWHRQLRAIEERLDQSSSSMNHDRNDDTSADEG